ncbi:carbohydrate binding domain-containing protein [Shewanella sp. UCD-KL21]|uniref:carbohydrate binding domain-containing protein n=1 Tax=Shewanella sp. UCD-KL21 TaxID=1917164 RepID=UPI000970420E|nr:carbohydrate binding domain-containing protein [Shewanella sp. UCD-KL21]
MPNTDSFGDSLLANSDFEIDASCWHGYDTSDVSITTKVFAGTQSLVGTARTQEYQGPSTNILSLVESGQTYQLFAQTAISEGLAQVKATISSTFESGKMVGQRGANIEQSTDFAHTGDKSALVNSRTNDWQGPVYDFFGQGVANTTYDMSGWIRVAGSESENVSINIKQTCEDSEAVYTDAGPAVIVSDSYWTLVSGTFTTPDCELTELSVYFSNATVGVDIYLDDAVLKLASVE